METDFGNKGKTYNKLYNIYFLVAELLKIKYLGKERSLWNAVVSLGSTAYRIK